MKQLVKVTVVAFLLGAYGTAPLAADGSNLPPWCPSSTSCTVQ